MAKHKTVVEFISNINRDLQPFFPALSVKFEA
jgi:hypothetical protein